MWMLNFPFPYESPEAGVLYRQMCDRQLAALHSRGTPGFAENLGEYLGARAALAEALEPCDYRYFSFQVWQEGIARYTEYRMAGLAAAHYEPTEAFCALEDYTTMQECAAGILDNTISSLEGMSLSGYGRVAFYSTGAGDALLLDEASPEWRSQYFKEWFALENLFKAE